MVSLIVSERNGKIKKHRNNAVFSTVLCWYNKTLCSKAFYLQQKLTKDKYWHSANILAKLSKGETREWVTKAIAHHNVSDPPVTKRASDESLQNHNATVEVDACLTASLTQQTPDKTINIYKIPLSTSTNLSCFSKHR